jgi:Cu(I)/Ag(I) efflux system periplasmic protein CusF
MKLANAIVAPIFVLISIGSAPVAAQPHAAGHGSGGHGQSVPNVPMTDGEVRKVDKDGGKLTLRHGEIRHMDMPPMTMVFRVRDKAMLDDVKAGDKVRFRVVDEAGTMVVTELQPVR